MTYLTPSPRAAAVAAIAEALTWARRVLLTTHLNADGDGAGCQAALAAWLRDRGREAWIVNPTPFPDAFAFLLPEREWCLDPGSARARELAAGSDLVVVLDTGEVPRIGRVAELARGIPTAVVDHHPPGDNPIEGLSLRDPHACATGELVFDVLAALGGPWPPAVALGLYVAILTDTGSFRFSNSTPAAHHIVAALLEAGVDPEDTYRRVYGSHPLSRLRLLHAALGELEVDPEGLLAWMTVPTEAFQGLGASSDDLEGLANYPREVQGVEVGLLFRETAKGGTKVSFRANGEVDVNALARRFGGGGHVKAAGAMVERPLVQVREEVVAATLEAIRAARRGEGSPIREDGP
jgi:phosphoesterase RecJ-like protein